MAEGILLTQHHPRKPKSSQSVKLTPAEYMEHAVSNLKAGKLIVVSDDIVKSKMDLSVVPLDIQSEVTEYIKHLSVQTDDHLVKFIGLPTTKIHGVVIGGAYVVEGNMPASKIIKNRDLCAGVTMCAITDLGDMRSFNDSKVGEMIAQKMQDYVNSSYFVDYSTEYFHENLTGETPDGFGLASRGASIGVYHSYDMEERNSLWYIVVRGYDEFASAKLYDYIQKNNPTVDDLHKSFAYKNALESSDNARLKLAESLANYLGVTLKKSETSGKIANLTNHYNFIKNVLYRNKNQLCYYEKCFASNENTSGVIFGLGRGVGYRWLSLDASELNNTTYGDKVFAFPMGVPSAVMRRDLVEYMRKQTKTQHYPNVLWGGLYRHNHKAIPDSYLPPDITKNKKWLDAIWKLIPQPKTDLKMHTITAYISASHIGDTSIEEIILFSKEEDKDLLLPVELPYIKANLMRDYLLYKSKNKGTRFSGDLVKKEDDHFLRVDKNLFMKIYKLHKQQQQQRQE